MAGVLCCICQRGISFYNKENYVPEKWGVVDRDQFFNFQYEKGSNNCDSFKYLDQWFYPLHVSCNAGMKIYTYNKDVCLKKAQPIGSDVIDKDALKRCTVIVDELLNIIGSAEHHPLFHTLDSLSDIIENTDLCLSFGQGNTRAFWRTL